MIELIVARDGSEVNRYFLPQGITTLGRADDNEIILDDVCVSRRHAQIRVEGVKVLIEDLGSGNGTFCGETRIARKELAHGDEVIIEPFHLTLRKAGPADSPSTGRRTPAKTVPPREMPDVGRAEPLMEPTDNRDQTSGGMAVPIRGPHLETIRGTGGRYSLESNELRIGRSEDQDIVLKDASASRGHAIISRRGSRYVLRDNNSANGTFVNGKQVSEHSLRPGDVILIGNTELRFVDPDSERPTTSKSTDSPFRAPMTASGTASAASSAGSGGMEMEMPIFDDSGDPATTDGIPPVVVPMDSPQDEGTIPGGPPPPVEAMDQLGMGGPPPLDPPGMPPTQGGPVVPYNGGYGAQMEMGMGNDLYPQSAPPDGSLVGRFLWYFKNNPRFRMFTIVGGVLFFLIVLIGIASNNDGGNKEPVLEGLSKQYMDAANQTFRDGKSAFERREWDEAIRNYEKVVLTTARPELSGIGEAQRLNLLAARQLFFTHEVKLLALTGTELENRVKAEAASAEQIAAARNAMNSAYTNAKRRSTLSNWQRVVSTSSQLLRYVPSDETAKSYQSEGRSNVNRIVGAQSAAQKEAIRQRAQNKFNIGMTEKRRGDAKSLNKAIKTLAGVKSTDPSNISGLHSRVDSEIAAIKRTLRRAAEPQLESGRGEMTRRDWVRARAALSRAVTIDPYNAEAQKLLAQAEFECTKSAKEAYNKAKVYARINNYSDARDQCKRAMDYHPRRSDLFNQKCVELIKELDRKQEGLR